VYGVAVVVCVVVRNEGGVVTAVLDVEYGDWVV
jgi:hypothetical protein